MAISKITLYVGLNDKDSKQQEISTVNISTLNNNTPETYTDMETNNTTLSALKRELQEYYDNAAKGGNDRRRNMILLRWDIRKMEREQQNA